MQGRSQPREAIDVGFQLANEGLVEGEIVLEVVERVADSCPEPAEQLVKCDPHLKPVACLFKLSLEAGRVTRRCPNPLDFP